MSLSKATSNSDLSSNENGQKSNNKPEAIRLDPFGVLQRDAFQKVLNYVELKDLQNKHGVSREWREQIDLHIRHRANTKPKALTIRVVFPERQNIFYGELCEQYLFFCDDIVQSVTNHLANRLPEIDGKLIVVSSEHFFHGTSFFEFIQQYFLSPTISRCTHITLGGSSSARLFALHTLAPISASCGLSHLSLQLPWEKFVQGKPRGLYWNELGRMLQTIKQEAANQVTSLSLRSRSSVVSFEDFWSKLVGKFVKIKSLRLHLLPAFAHVSLFKK